MKQHEREFFIYTIRSGKVKILDNVYVHPPTIDQVAESCYIYNTIYDESYEDEVMTEEEMIHWMREHDLWSDENDTKIKGLQEDLEKLKVEIYNARNNSNLADKIRLYIRAGEKQLSDQLSIKHQYFQNTCEGIAYTEKISWIVANTTYKEDELYDFETNTLAQVVHKWQNAAISEPDCRELARNEPWKSLWATHEKGSIKLFLNRQDQDLTYNQKNLLVWSQMYDNIQESMDCPTTDVIDDDDMLDGWFIIQSRKRDKERAESEFENSTNEKIKNSSEVYVMSRSDRDRERVEGMNDMQAQAIKRQRSATIKKKGTVGQHEFKDEIMRIKNQQAEAWKNKRGG